jgi:dienelactone hydrolase
VSAHRSGEERHVRIPSGDVYVDGDLVVPPDAPGIVVFAHGSGSSRHSSRNRAVARVFREGGLGTLLMDLLTPEEEAVDRVTREHRFDIPLLAGRLVDALSWVEGELPALARSVGLFGASTGAAAALVAAGRASGVRAIVSRGGRPDLAGDALSAVRAPTLLIVGGADTSVIAMNRTALARFHAPVQLRLVPGATHLFEEPGALETVAELAREWFLAHLGAPAPPA